MKEATYYFSSKGIIFKYFNEVSPKELGSRKKIKIYDALSTSKEYYAIFKIDSKSRFLRKNADELTALINRLIEIKDHNYKHKILLISSPLCSKALELLKNEGWDIDSL